LTRPRTVRKGGASSAGASLGRAFLCNPCGEANAPIVANDPDNAPIGPEIGEDPQIDSLEQRIAAARKTEDERMAKEHAPVRDARGAAIGIASTMVGYPLGGIVVGFGLDRFVFGTTPWITIGLMFLAFIGACIQVVRENSNRAG
jgi:F0F1-type ATP synthase assembly protein I